MGQHNTVCRLTCFAGVRIPSSLSSQDAVCVRVCICAGTGAGGVGRGLRGACYMDVPRSLARSARKQSSWGVARSPLLRLIFFLFLLFSSWLPVNHAPLVCRNFVVRDPAFGPQSPLLQGHAGKCFPRHGSDAFESIDRMPACQSIHGKSYPLHHPTTPISET